MADCRQISTSLAAFAFDALEESERALVQAHLDGCPACRGQLALYRPLPALLDLADGGESEIASPPPLLEASVAAAVPHAPQGTGPRFGKRRRTARILAAALACGIAIGAGLVALRSSSPPPASELRVALAPSGLQPHAGARALLRERPWGTEVDLVARLAPTRGDAVYEVWFVAAHGRLSAGTFTVPAGRAQVSVRLASAARLRGRSGPTRGRSGPTRYRYLGITLQSSALDPAVPGRNVLRARLPS